MILQCRHSISYDLADTVYLMLLFSATIFRVFATEIILLTGNYFDYKDTFVGTIFYTIINEDDEVKHKSVTLQINSQKVHLLHEILILQNAPTLTRVRG